MVRASGTTADIDAGDLIADRYRILHRLGGGGMAEVFAAEDERLNRRVALKVLPSPLVADSSAVDRTRREARAVAALQHPNVVSVFDFVDEPGVVAIVMESVNGPSLKQRLEQEPLELAEAAALFRQVCAGVGAAHAVGIIHRDLKPSNVLLTKAGSAKVADFGVAAILDETAVTDAIRGSVPYVAPEQARGLPPDARADVYGLGCLLHEMLTGRPPFIGSTMEVLGQHLEATPPRPSTIRSEVPAALDEVAVRALAKDPGERFVDAEAMAAAVERAVPSSAGVIPRDQTMLLPPIESDETTVIAAAVPASASRRGGVWAFLGADSDDDAPRRRQVRRAGIVVGFLLVAFVALASLSAETTPTAADRLEPEVPTAPAAPASPSPSATPSRPTSFAEAVDEIAGVIAMASSSGALTGDGQDKLEDRIRDLRREMTEGPPWERSEGVREQLDKLDEDVEKLVEEGEINDAYAEQLADLTDRARELVPEDSEDSGSDDPGDDDSRGNGPGRNGDGDD